MQSRTPPAEGRLVKGSVFKKASNGRWYVVTHGLRPDGTRKQTGHGGYRTRKEAEARLREVLNQLDSGTYVGPSHVTLAAYLLDDWLPSIRGRVRPSTFQSYEHNMRAHIVPALGGIGLQALTPLRLNALYAELLVTGRRRGTAGGLSPKTVRYIHTTLHKALGDAVDSGILAMNPAAKAKPPKPSAAKSPEMKTWTASELLRFLTHVSDDRLYAAWHLAASTGMRRGEVLGVRWSDVNLDEGRVSVAQALTSVGYKVMISDTKTTRGTRMVDIDPKTVAALRAHRTRQQQERLAWGPGYRITNLVFTRPDGEWIHPDRFSQMFRAHVAAAEVPSIRFHDLRHTHATLMLQAEIAPKVISDRLGHATVAFTMDRYAHAIPAMQAEAAGRVADLVWGAS